ncbi:retrovirus-related pol polyprotein from transposon TNT 1-94 [Tanacetum coccineum]
MTQSPINHHASTSLNPVPQDRWSRDQHIELVNIIGEPTKGMLTRSMAAKLIAVSVSECLFADFLFEIEPKKVSKALKYPGWVDAMQEEPNQFYRNKVWTLVSLPRGKIAIGSMEGIDYDETFAPVARMKAIRIFLSYATYMNIKFLQMDVKSAFLNGKLKEEVYVKQPPGFESSEFPDYVFLQKSTSSACQLLGGKLVCWNAKKQQSVDMSSVEAEYVNAARCCANIL